MTNLRIGMIGLDTSHVTAFTDILNDPNNPHHVPGGRVTVAFPGGSPDFELSHSRVAGFTDTLRTKHGVKMVDSPEAVAEACDLLFIESVDGRVHREMFERTVSFGRPTFIDKPVATTSTDAEAIYKLAAERGVPVMSCSALRYAQAFEEALAKVEPGGVLGIDVFGPMAEQPTQPGLFWYGIHTVELIVAALGTGLKELHAIKNADFDLVTAEWQDGRLASLRGARRGHGAFGVTLHLESGPVCINLSAPAKPFYAGLIEAIMRSLPRGKSDVPAEQTIEIVDFIEAANESRKTGHTIKL